MSPLVCRRCCSVIGKRHVGREAARAPGGEGPLGGGVFFYKEVSFWLGRELLVLVHRLGGSPSFPKDPPPGDAHCCGRCWAGGGFFEGKCHQGLCPAYGDPATTLAWRRTLRAQALSLTGSIAEEHAMGA